MEQGVFMAVEDWASLTLLTSMVLGDDPRWANADAIFIYAQNDLQEELLTQVAKFYHRFSPPQRPKIIINGLGRYERDNSKQQYSWGGGEWQRVLKGPLGVLPADIITVAPCLHTGEESQRMVSLARTEGWKTLILAATPYHLPRCFLTALGVARQKKLDLRFYFLTVPSSVVSNSRFARIEAELKKIAKYRNLCLAGDLRIAPLASPTEGLRYLKERV